MVAPLHPGGCFSREKIGGSARESAQCSIDLTDAAAKGRPFSFRKPWVASDLIAEKTANPTVGVVNSRRHGSHSVTLTHSIRTVLTVSSTVSEGDHLQVFPSSYERMGLPVLAGQGRFNGPHSAKILLSGQHRSAGSRSARLWLVQI
jgi:hypothetical protein